VLISTTFCALAMLILCLSGLAYASLECGRMAGMEPEIKKSFEFSWGKAVGIVVLLVAIFYASQTPHSIFAYIVKFILIPVP